MISWYQSGYDLYRREPTRGGFRMERIFSVEEIPDPVRAPPPTENGVAASGGGGAGVGGGSAGSGVGAMNRCPSEWYEEFRARQQILVRQMEVTAQTVARLNVEKAVEFNRDEEGTSASAKNLVTPAAPERWAKPEGTPVMFTSSMPYRCSTDGQTETKVINGRPPKELGEDKFGAFVQISPETHAHLTESEELVQVLNEKVKILNEKLSAAQSEITTKDALVKQHAKVAEEAVSGWDKAEAEASTLKVQLETVTLSKLASEERAAHLDGALKECMKQVRSVKEEGEQKLHDVVFAKTRQWEKIKAELEGKLLEFEQEFIRAGAENDALSRSLQERSDLSMKIDEEKAQAEADIEVLTSTIRSGEREINSLKYELHVVSIELEIRNDEQNMSVRSADVTTKQHLEDVKKMSKLEAECQRLRGLVRKKLPGPAALAQMKMEVESLGRDYGDNRLRRSSAKNSSFHRPMSPVPDYAFDNLHHMHKENEFLTARVLAMEEENKKLKEALTKRNSELQTSRSMYAKTAGKLRSLEVQILTGNQRKSPTNSNRDIHFDGALSQDGSNSTSMTSMSEDGVDDEGSCTEFSGPTDLEENPTADAAFKTELKSSEPLVSASFAQPSMPALPQEKKPTEKNESIPSPTSPVKPTEPEIFTTKIGEVTPPPAPAHYVFSKQPERVHSFYPTDSGANVDLDDRSITLEIGLDVQWDPGIIG